jgi:glutamate--cysteine ligase
LKDFDPCTILLNNELTKGLPGILEELHEQFVLPPLHASGSIRRKSTHYKTMMMSANASASCWALTLG